MRQRPVYHVVRMFGGWAGSFPSYQAAIEYRNKHCPSGRVMAELKPRRGCPLH